MSDRVSFPINFNCLIEALDRPAQIDGPMTTSDYLSSLFSLSGRVAVVIGGTGELCGAMAEGLAGAGAEVVLVGRNADKAQNRLDKISAAGGKAWFHPA